MEMENIFINKKKMKLSIMENGRTMKEKGKENMFIQIRMNMKVILVMVFVMVMENTNIFLLKKCMKDIGNLIKDKAKA